MFSLKTSVMMSAIIISDHGDHAHIQNFDAVPDFSILLASVELEWKKSLQVV